MRYAPPKPSKNLLKRMRKAARESPEPPPQIKAGSLGWKQGPIFKANSIKK